MGIDSPRALICPGLANLCLSGSRMQTMNKSHDASARAGISSALLPGKSGTCDSVKLQLQTYTSGVGTSLWVFALHMHSFAQD